MSLEDLIAEERKREEERDRKLFFEHALRHDTYGAFESFVRLMWPEVEQDTLEWAPYMSVVCDYVHRHVLGDQDYRKLLIMLPPGTSKSLIVSVFKPAFEWLFDPGYRSLFFTGNDDLSTRDSRRTRRALESPTYIRLQREWARRNGEDPWEFARDQQEKRNFETDRGGFRQCLTLRTGVTGKRGAGWVVDDPLDVKAVLLGGYETIERRCREANEIVSQLSSRVNDLRVARQLMCMQRLHIHDPAGYKLAEGDWKVLCLPMHYDPKHPHASPDDPRTVPGERLHQARHTDAVVAQLRKDLGRLADAQLELRPVPSEGGLIKREWLRERYTCRPEDIASTADEVWVSSDAAKKGTITSDFNAIQVWALKGGKRYILDRVYARMSSIDYFSALDGMIAKWAHAVRLTSGGVLIEDTANGTNYIDAREPAYMGAQIIRFHPNKDTPGNDYSKGARARFFERAAQAGAVILPSPKVCQWVSDYEENIYAFPLGANDDDMDASSQINMRWTLQDQHGDIKSRFASLIAL